MKKDLLRIIFIALVFLSFSGLLIWVVALGNPSITAAAVTEQADIGSGTVPIVFGIIFVISAVVLALLNRLE